MKKLIFGLIAVVMLGNLSFGQVNSELQKTKLLCVTLSCCSVGPFGIEVWSQKTCHYVSANKSSNSNGYTHTMKFETAKPIKELEVLEDVLLAGQYDEKENNLVLPKGVYLVENGAINFKAVVAKAAKTYCYIKEVNGTLFGHDYGYSIKWCVTVDFGRQGTFSIFPKLSDDEIKKVLTEQNGKIAFKEDVVLKEDGLNCVLKAGEYILNENGGIYLQNVNVK